MRYPPEVLEEVRMANDIVSVVSSYVPLKQKGNSYFGLCPFHNESTPSFSVSAEKQLYYCFGCGASGNVITFVMAIENHDFVSAVKFLADRVHYTLPEGEFSQEQKEKAKLKEDLYAIHVVAARFFYNSLQSVEGQKAVAYLDNRGVLPNIRVKFGLGYSSPKGSPLYHHLREQGYTTDLLIKSGLVIQSKRKENTYFDRFFGRLMFPILDVNNKVVGFGGRIIDEGEPKYLNSPDTLIFDKSRNLYGLNFARKTKATTAILVEGYMDVIALVQAGFTNAVASLGTAFNIEHARLLRKYVETVILLFDSDEAGTNAALRAMPILLSQGFKIKVLQLKGAKDPDEFIKKFGRNAFEKALETSMDHIAFQVFLLQKKYNLEIIEQKIEFTFEISKILAGLHNDVLIDAYTQEVANMTHISPQSIKSHIETITARPFVQGEPNYKKGLEYREKTKTKEKGLIESQKSLIYIISKDVEAYQKVKEVLNPEELNDPVYVQLLSIIYRMHSEKQSIYPAEIVNFFETKEEQKVVSEIFNTVLPLADRKDLQKAINQQVQRIKRANIERQKQANKGDLAAIHRLRQEELNLPNLNITLIDG